MDSFFEEISFPYSSLRKGQDTFIKTVFECISEKKPCLVSAPTGLGKTISAMAPAIYHAKKNKQTVVFLTSRQTQANQAIATVKDLCAKSKDKISYVAFIGKRNMCAHADKDLYPASDFFEFCKRTRQTGKCKFFKNTRDEEQTDSMQKVLDISSDAFMSVEGFVQLCADNKFCPFELAAKKSFKADLVICDYNYLFAPGMRESFLGKIGRQINECIVIVDEAHNLPSRISAAYSNSLSLELIRLALKELQDYVKSKTYDKFLFGLEAALQKYAQEKMEGDKKECLVGKKEFLDSYLSSLGDTKLKDIIDKFTELEALVKEDRMSSHLGKVAIFLKKWKVLDEESFLRILEKETKAGKTSLTLRIKCIDPSSISSEVLLSSAASVIMSATLSPISMYKDILGLPEAKTLELESPFSKKNQLMLAVTDVSSKYSARSKEMFTKIAKHITNILNSGHDKNAIVFFPSYDFMDKVTAFISMPKLERKVMKELRYMSKEQKEEIVHNFKNAGGVFAKPKVLFAITSGSFSEGLDLPKEALEMVLVVGLPLGVPDLTTERIIAHYEKKFPRKGQFYGYIYPAISKIIQAAGRCIRTEKDRGVIALLDNRFPWPLYAQSFPSTWEMIKEEDPFKISGQISEFFEK